MPQPDPLDVQIGGNMRQLRIKRRLSMECVGKHLGVTYQQIRKYESGDNRVTADGLYRLASLLQCRLLDFFETPDPSAVGERVPHRTILTN